MPLTSRRMMPEEPNWQAVLGLILGAFAYMDGVIDPPSSAKRLTVESLRQKAEQEHALVLFDGEIPVACIFCDPRADCLYVGKLAVSDEWRGKGLGKQLIGEAEALALQLGYSELELQSRVELTANHRFFEALGFVKTGETAHAGYDRPTSITMRKQIRAISILPIPSK